MATAPKKITKQPEAPASRGNFKPMAPLLLKPWEVSEPGYYFRKHGSEVDIVLIESIEVPVVDDKKPEDDPTRTTYKRHLRCNGLLAVTEWNADLLMKVNKPLAFPGTRWPWED